MQLIRCAAAAVMLAGAAGASLAATAPSDIPSKADAAAWNLLRKAHDDRYAFPADFPGVTATVNFSDAAGNYTGTLTWPARGKMSLTMNGIDADMKAWLDDQVGSIFSHRRAGSFEQGDGQYPVTFGTPGDEALLGRQVALNDGLDSTYRVKDDVLTEVTRTMGPMRFTISVMDVQRVSGGKYIPHTFTVTYFDAKTGALQDSMGFDDTYQHMFGVWLPVSRQVTLAKDGHMTARKFTLTDIHVLSKPGGGLR